MKQEICDKINSLITLLKSGQFTLIDEKLCQDDIQDLLDKYNVPYKREYNLGTGIVDFYLTRSRIAIEVKAIKKWQKLEVYRQCERYCQSEEVDGLLLATGASLTLPDSINDKPTMVYHLAKSNL